MDTPSPARRRCTILKDPRGRLPFLASDACIPLRRSPSMAAYDQEYRRSLDDPEGFWGEVAEDVRWTKRWDQVLDRSKAPLYRWFRGGELNTCFNAVDRHVEEGRAEQLALIWDSPLAGETRKLTYRELRDEVARFAGALPDQ